MNSNNRLQDLVFSLTLNRPIIAQNVNNTINKKGVITRYTKLNLELNTIDEQLLIINTGKSPIILGLLWLK